MRLKEIKPGMVVRCKTAEEANQLLSTLDKAGYKWVTGFSLLQDSNYRHHKSLTCYRIGENERIVSFSDISYYENNGDKITEFSSLIIEEKTYEDGLNDAWEFFRKIYDLKCDDIEKIFNTNGGVYGVISSTIPIKDMIAKLEAYEAENQIKVGDVVNVINNESYDSETGIFLGEEYKHYWVLLPKYSVPQSLGKSRYTIKKAGKHIDISSILAEIGKE